MADVMMLLLLLLLLVILMMQAIASKTNSANTHPPHSNVHVQTPHSAVTERRVGPCAHTPLPSALAGAALTVKQITSAPKIYAMWCVSTTCKCRGNSSQNDRKQLLRRSRSRVLLTRACAIGGGWGARGGALQVPLHCGGARCATSNHTGDSRINSGG